MSRFFSDQSPVIPHLSRGKEVGDLRSDVAEALQRVENELGGTQEAFTVNVDPVNGSDDFKAGSRLCTQVAASSHGAFASIKGVLAALPSFLKHTVTLAFADGDYDVQADDFEELSRFVRGGAYTMGPGGIVLTSANGWERVDGTGEEALTSGSATGCELAADPGLAVNALRSTMTRIVSGTGVTSNQRPVPVRAHSGTTVEVLKWDEGETPDATSTVEFLQPKARLIVSGFLMWKGPGVPGSPMWPLLSIDAIDVVASGATWFYLLDMHAYIGSARFFGVSFNVERADVQLGHSLFDGQGIGSTFAEALLSIASGSVRTAWTPNALLFRDSGGNGIRIASDEAQSPQKCLFLGEAAFDDITLDAIRLAFGDVSATLEDKIRTNNVGGYALRATFGARVKIRGTFSAANQPGTTGEVLLDGAATPWSDLNSDPDKFLTGGQGSVLGVVPSEP